MLGVRPAWREHHMNTVVRIALFLVAAALSWLALLVLGASRARVLLQTRVAWRGRTRYRFRQNGVLGRRVAPSRDQPAAVTFRREWF
jgi:hypothetical protein